MTFINIFFTFISLLSNLGIIKSNNKSSKIFEDLFPNILNEAYITPSEFIILNWKRYNTSIKNDNSINGKIFEYLLAILLIKEGIKPFYIEATVAFVPNVVFDLMLYSAECGPICISLKTSLRERYKQADLEAMALKYVHRNSKSFLVNMNQKETITIGSKIITGDIIGLDQIVYAGSEEFNNLIFSLHGYNFIKPEKIEIIRSSRLVS